MIEIRELTHPEFDQELAELLIDTVESGGSIGFMPPVSNEDARGYWSDVFSAIAAGGRTLSIAIVHGKAIGAVQLGLETRANGLHRAEVMKLMVHRSARGQGVGEQLMLHVEELARSLGRTLLVLDTRRGDTAERLYLRLGYLHAGIIPAYARSSTGELHDTVFLYKQLV